MFSNKFFYTNMVIVCEPLHPFFWFFLPQLQPLTYYPYLAEQPFCFPYIYLQNCNFFSYFRLKMTIYFFSVWMQVQSWNALPFIYKIFNEVFVITFSKVTHKKLRKSHIFFFVFIYLYFTNHFTFTFDFYTLRTRTCILCFRANREFLIVINF